MVRARGLPRLLLLAACLLCASARASASATTADYVRWVRVDYYGALNVTSRANATEIKSKYRRLALQFHPDKLGHLGARERKVAEDSFKVLAEGKEVLTDPDRRAAYDETIAMLPRFARPKHGRRSVFDKESVKVGVLPVVLGFGLLLAAFASVNQRFNQISDRGSLMRSKYYQQKFKAAAKRRVKRRGGGANAKAAFAEAEYFREFCEEENILFLEGWRYTTLGRWFSRTAREELARKRRVEEEIRAARLEEVRAEEERRASRERKGASSKKGNAASGGKGRGGGRSSSGPGGDDRAGDKPNPVAPARVRTEDPEARIRAERRRAAREARLARLVSGFPEDWEAFERRTLDSEQQQRRSRECDLTRPFSAVSVLRACVAAGIVDIDGEAGIVDSETVSESTRDAYERAMASLVERFGGGGGSDAEAADEATLRALDACFDAAEAERRAQRREREAAEEEGAVKEGAESSSDGSDRPERSATEADTSVGEYAASGAEAAAADSVYDAAEDPEVVAAEAAKAAKKEKAKAAKAAIAAKAKAANRAAKDASRGGGK